MSKWELVREETLKDGRGSLQLLRWPLPASGGNREGEHWVRVLSPNGVSTNNQYYWGPQASERALKAFEAFKPLFS